MEQSDLQKAKQRIDRVPKYFYHITEQQDWGTKIRLKPLPTDHPQISNRGDEEPFIARICVGPTIHECLGAICWVIDRNKPLHIYRTARKVFTVKPWDVWDSKITRERWRITPTVFVRVGTIPRVVVKDLPCRCYGEKDPRQKEQIEIIKELLRVEKIVV